MKRKRGDVFDQKYDKMPQVSEFGLDPLFFSHCKLFNKQIIHTIEPKLFKWNKYKKINENNNDEPTINGAEHLLYQKHPIQYAAVVGYLVGIDRKTGRNHFIIDDGTELIDCIEWLNRDFNEQARRIRDANYKIGSLVRAFGKLNVPPLKSRNGRQFLQRRQLNLNSKLEIVDDMNFEVLHWMQVIDLTKSTYDKVTPIVYKNKNLKKKQIRQTISPRKSLKKLLAKILNDATIMPLLSEYSIKHIPALQLTEEENPLKKVCFDVESLLNLQEVKETIRNIDWVNEIDKHNNQKSAEDVMIEILNEEFAIKGAIFQVDTVAMLYAVVTISLILAPAILSIISKAQIQQNYNYNGVPRHIIVKQLHRDERTRKVSDSRVEKALNYLIENSHIHEVIKGNSYRISNHETTM